jgi:hypothetical protein
MFVPLTLDIVPSEWTLKVTGRKKAVVLFVSTSHAPTNGAQDDARAVPTDPKTTAPTRSTARDIFLLNMISLSFRSS